MSKVINEWINNNFEDGPSECGREFAQALGLSPVIFPIQIIESDVKCLCAFKSGWTPKFYKEFVVIASPDSPPYAIPLATIQEGDILPRECDEVYKIQMWDLPKVMDE